MTHVLVAYATKMGTTREIAEEIAARLAERGLDVELADVSTVREVTPYDAVVVGSAVYMTRWRGEAVAFLRRNAEELAARRVWAFHSGPVGEKTEEPVAAPPGVRKLLERIGAVPVHTFAGALIADRARGFVAKKMARGPLAGDFRDHDAIRAWADTIADELSTRVG
jgi:menaquinone-dependent protoporphyrinogen oxidase